MILLFTHFGLVGVFPAFSAPQRANTMMRMLPPNSQCARSSGAQRYASTAGGAQRAAKVRRVGLMAHLRQQRERAPPPEMRAAPMAAPHDPDHLADAATSSCTIEHEINKDLNFPSAPGAAGHRTTKKGTSRHRGVCWNKSPKKWVAQIRVDGKVKYLGSFVDEDDAARAYDAYIRKHYPDKRPHGWKRFNFPSADGEEGSADGGDDAGSARGGASSSSAAAVAARAEEEEDATTARRVFNGLAALTGSPWASLC